MRLALAALVVLTAARVHAQPAAPVDSNPGRMAGGRGLRTPVVSAPINLGASLATAAFSAGEATADLRLLLAASSTDQGQETLALTAGAPITRTATRTALFDETGLGRGANLGLAYTRAFFSAGDGVDPNVIGAVCIRHTGRRACRRATLPTEDARREFDAVTRFRPPTTFGLTAAIGRETFDYVEVVDGSVAERSDTRTGYTAAAGLGRVFDPIRSFVGLSFRYGRGFDAGSTRQVCQPLGADGASACREAAVGGPTETVQSLAALEARSFFQRFALAPRAAYDTRARRWRLEVPLYLFQNERGGFVGGITARVAEYDPRIGYSVFIGRALSSQVW